MSTTDTLDMGFTALPAGWYNYYSETDERGRRKVFRSPCPGILKVQFIYTEADGTKTEGDFEFRAADFSGATLTEADGANYLGTFYGEEYWQEVGKAPNEETVSV